MARLDGFGVNLRFPGQSNCVRLPTAGFTLSGHQVFSANRAL